MPRPNRVIGHLSPWVEYADELEAELAALREAMTEVLENVPMDVHYRHLLAALLQEKGE